MKGKKGVNHSNLASFRALCMADSIKAPEAACSAGIGTPIKIPLPSPSFMFASAKEQKQMSKENKNASIRYTWEV